MKVTLYRPKTHNGKGRIWYAKWRPIGASRYKRRSLGVTQKNVARRIAEEIEKQLAQERYGLVIETDWTHKEAWDQYLRVVNKKPKTLQNEKCFWDQFWAWSGAPTLRSVRRSDVAEWQQHLLNEEGNSPVSINNKVRQVSTVWNWLKREEIYDGPNPFAGRKPLDEGPRKLRVIPWEKMKELLQVAEEGADLAAREAATDPDSLKKRNLARSRRSLYLALVLGAYAGLRRKEILAVRWEHIDWERKELQVHGTKSEASHATVHLHETLESALLPYRKDAGYLVMAGKRTSRAKDRKHPVEYRYDYKSAWTTLRKKVGLQDARWHDLRHSFATRLLDLGYSMKDIAIMLRHSSTRPTERYADLRVLKVRIGSLDGAPATSADEEDAA